MRPKSGGPRLVLASPPSFGHTERSVFSAIHFVEIRHVVLRSSLKSARSFRSSQAPCSIWKAKRTTL